MGISKHMHYTVRAFFLGLAGLMVLSVSLAVAESKTVEQENLASSHRGDYLYYPAHARSAYDYQSTGDFAARPMVIPSSLPVIRQPSQYIVQAPPAIPMVPRMAMLSQNEASAPNNTGRATTYNLHLGSFLEPVNADLLEQQLIASGVRVFRRDMNAQGTFYQQLYAGPFNSRQDALQAASWLQKNMNLQGKMVTF